MQKVQRMPQKDAGRVWVIVVIVVVLAEWPISRAFHAGSPLGGLAGSLIGLLVSLTLCVFLYRGANWARSLLGILSVFGSPALIFGLVDLFSGDLRLGAYFITVGMTSIFVAAVLLFLPAVRAYCAEENIGATG
jgi:uncharacterized membrane protein